MGGTVGVGGCGWVDREEGGEGWRAGLAVSYARRQHGWMDGWLAGWLVGWLDK